jgi:galactokinase
LGAAAALERAAWVAASRTQHAALDLHAIDLGAHARGAKLDALGAALPRWAWYPAGVAWSLRESGLVVTGLRAVLASDVPIGSGLSSSAAVEVAFAWTWRALLGLALERPQLARLAQHAENAFVGVNCGIMDQFASA